MKYRQQGSMPDNITLIIRADMVMERYKVWTIRMPEQVLALTNMDMDHVR